MTPTPPPPMDERRLALAKAYAAGVRGQLIPDGSTLVAELLAEVDRLRDAGARETARLDWLEWQFEVTAGSGDDCFFWTPDMGSSTPTALREMLDLAMASDPVPRAARTPSPGDRAPNPRTRDGAVSDDR